MPGKQFKILNNKLNSLLQIQADNRGRNFVFGFEMEYMLKSRDNRLRILLENIEKQQVERPEVHANRFDYEIQKLSDVAKEYHELFFEKVNTTKDSIDLKMAELKSEMAKEIKKIEKSCFVLHRKVDVVADAIAKLV
ncbi:unnamed protein product [Lactuca saligna]|uniref:Uncharacterized protein n=1 Tax=Lactuca saligna TaxID=75948 RepID=A0AA35ZTU0_LACSI|nr:unnamed protein product [Lactuca saligna]